MNTTLTLPQVMPRLQRGITLIELMIVVVIVSILAVVAYPGYQEFAARAKRNEARSALLQIATNQERFYLDNRTFTTDLTTMGLGANAATYRTPSGAYDIVINNADAASWDATATFLLGGSEAGKCLTFTINGAGARGSGPDGNCWERSR
ncbi:MAG: type IV pilin protein [Pseudomonadota bacterium]